MAHGFTAMVDMSKSAADVKKEVGEMCAPVGMPKVDEYPWGLRVSLDTEVLAKLKMGELPTVGEMIHFCSMGKVTSVSESEREASDGSKSKDCHVEIQITHLAMFENEDRENEMATKARRGRFYDAVDGVKPEAA